MPTGYTAKVEDGTITELKDFVLQCARAFGACLHQRDEDGAELPKLRELTDYYERKIDDAKKNIQKIEDMSDEELFEDEKKYLEKSIEDYENILVKKRQIRERYERMLEKVEAWQPPTEDHVGLKTYMLDQLEDSMEFDCDENYYINIINECKDRLNDKLDADDIRNKKKEGYIKNLDYYAEAHAKEKKSVESSNAWITALYKSFE